VNDNQKETSAMQKMDNISQMRIQDKQVNTPKKQLMPLINIS
jgi:hypothetical protein